MTVYSKGDMPISTDTLVTLRNCLSKMSIAINKELERRNPTKIVDESIFMMSYVDKTSPKLTDYQVAVREGNEEKFDYALKILKEAFAKIDNRYHGTNYNHSYWIFGNPERIYRQKLRVE